MIATADRRDSSAGARSPVAAMAIAGVLAAVAVGAGVSSRAAEPGYWLAMLWLSWILVSGWVVLSRWPSLAVAGLQVFFLLEVLAPATLAVRDGRTMIAVYDVTAGTVGALQLSVLAQLAIGAGAVGARAWHGSRAPAVVRDQLPAGRLDRWAIMLVLGALAGMAAYIGTAGGDPRRLVVLVGSARYGEFAKLAEGPVVKYFSVLVGLAGVAIVVATLRLTSARARSRMVPVAVIVCSALLLISGGARWWLGIPAVAAVLVWWRTTQGGWAQRPRRILAAGALGLFVVAVVVGGLRTQTGEKSIDTEEFVAKQLAGGVFATTAVLVDTVPARHAYLGGTSYAEVVTLPVPRAWWADKPEGEVKELQRAFFRQEIGASFAFYGEAYANFGWVGAGLLTAAFGFLLESVWLRLVRARHVTEVVALAMAIPMLLQLFTRGYLAGLLAGMFGFVLGTALVVRGLSRLVHRTAT